MAKLKSIQVGRPAEQVYEHPQDGRESTWVSGIGKERVDEPVMLYETHLEGDGQADLVNHGGPDRPVLMYSADHYRGWTKELKEAGLDGQFRALNVLAGGAFGENFTVSGLTEDTVCIGDIFYIRGVVVQASQPRKPCWKLGRKHNLPELPALVERLGWTGWYVRVLTPGVVQAGMQIELVERLHPQWTIGEVHRIMRERLSVPDEAAKLAACEELSADWRRVLAGEA